MPKVGIALATYNPDLRFFKDQIASLQNQSFANWVCVISDDASASDCFEEIKNIVSADTRFQCVQTVGRLNVIKNFEHALLHLPKDCDFIAFCDQDDLWQPQKLERLLKEFSNPQIQLAHSDLELIDENNNSLAPSCWAMEKRDVKNISLDDLIARNVVTGCTCLFRKELLSTALPFYSQSEIHYFHDHWLAMQALRVGQIASVAEPLVRYRQHGQNVVGAYQGSQSSLLKKITNLKSLFARSRKAYQHRLILLQDFLKRAPNAELGNWRSPQFVFFFFIKKSIKNPICLRIGLQVFIGSFLEVSS